MLTCWAGWTRLLALGLHFPHFPRHAASVERRRRAQLCWQHHLHALRFACLLGQIKSGTRQPYTLTWRRVLR